MASDPQSPRSLVGMIHVGALPGTPRHSTSLEGIVEHAVSEARLLVEAGFDALLLENMHDVPYLRATAGPEVVAAMTAVACAVRAEVTCPIGIQILAGANREALAVALAGECQFIRSEGFVFGHLADEGWIQSDAGELLRYRRNIGGDNIRVLADIRKKHSSHAVTADLRLEDIAQAAEFFGADGLIVTGNATGRPVDRSELRRVREATTLPVLVGSGVTPENLPHLWPYAESFIVGSWIKRDGFWENSVDPVRVQRMVAAAQQLREKG